MAPRKSITEVVSVTEIAETYLKLRKDPRSVKLTGYPTTLERGMSGWGGAELRQIDDWVTNGYFESDPLTMPDGSAEMLVPTMEWDEDEGDLIYSAAVAGEDLFKVTMQNEMMPKGISIKARLYISAMVGAQTVNDYVEWLLGVIDGVDRSGETPDVSIYAIADATNGTEVIAEIPLRKAGEAIDAASWRALLAPGGYRCLVFLAQYIAATRHNLTLNSGLGSRRVRDGGLNSWNVEYDDATLDIQPAATMGGFNKAKLTEKIQELIK